MSITVLRKYCSKILRYISFIRVPNYPMNQLKPIDRKTAPLSNISSSVFDDLLIVLLQHSFPSPFLRQRTSACLKSINFGFIRENNLFPIIFSQPLVTFFEFQPRFHIFLTKQPFFILFDHSHRCFLEWLVDSLLSLYPVEVTALHETLILLSLQ